MRRELIVNADDFGFDPRTNRAVAEAHLHGILTSASLMVNEAGAAEAVEAARANPSLAVGLHVVLSDGRSARPPSVVPHLADSQGRFGSSPAAAGLVCFFSRAARREVAAEVEAQFERFAATGLPFDHVNGHQHLHMHPVIWDCILAQCDRFAVPAIRIPFEEFRPHSRNHLAGRRVEWLFFRALRRRCLRSLDGRRIIAAGRVYGHLETGCMDGARLLDLLGRLGGATNEVYLHPGTPHAVPLIGGPQAMDVELAALLSPAVRARVEELGITLTTYGQLAAEGRSSCPQ